MLENFRGLKSKGNGDDETHVRLWERVLTDLQGEVREMREGALRIHTER